MSVEAEESPLLARLHKVGNDLTLTERKQQGLPRSEIKERVSAFMLSNHGMSGVIAFGEGAHKENSSEGIQHFDPISELRKNPSNLDEILMLVDHDMYIREQELLHEAQEYQSSYNVLLFGAAAKLVRDEQLSDALRELVINHLINPPDFPTQSKGKPKRNPQVDEQKYFAVKFAMQHGLKPTRNDESEHHSACDIVAEAALELWRKGYSNFASGYGYESLKKIYHTESKTRREHCG